MTARPSDQALLQPRGAAAGHLRRRPQGRRVPRRLVPGHLRRCPHRHRPRRRCASSTNPTTGSDPGHQTGRGHQPVRCRDHRPRRSHSGVPGEARPRRSALRPRQLRHLHVPGRDLRLLSGAGTSKAAGTATRGLSRFGLDVFPGLLAGDIPFFWREIDAYWNDIGNLEELRETISMRSAVRSWWRARARWSTVPQWHRERRGSAERAGAVAPGSESATTLVLTAPP